MIDHYYEAELEHLVDVGAELSELHPDLARFLHRHANDPDVERLRESFAFLAARIQQRLDDELPELTHTLLGLLYPHYLRPMPAATIVEFRPRPGARAPQSIPRGTPIGGASAEGPTCVFQTCYPVDLLPMTLDVVGLERGSEGRGTLRLAFAAQPAVDAASLGHRRIRLYLAGEDEVARILLKLLSRDVTHARVRFTPASTTPVPPGPYATVDATRFIRPVGFEATDDDTTDDRTDLLPHPTRSFSGYRLLQEYFFFPAKFHFVDLDLTEVPVRDAGSVAHMEIEIGLNELPPRLGPIDADRVRLHCTPVVNLFPHDGEPLVVDQRRSEYKVCPDHQHPEHYDVFSVEGVHRVAPDHRAIPHLYSFAFHARADDVGNIAHETVLRPRLGGRPGTDTYLRFVAGRGAPVADPPQRFEDLLPPGETLSVDLLCTNGDLPTRLAPGDVCRPVSGTPEYVEFENIGAIAPSVAPPVGDDLHWKLISHLTLNYVSLSGVDELRGLLQMYDFLALRNDQARRRTRRRLEGITGVRTTLEDDLYRGAPVRVVHTRLHLEEENFAGTGDLFLFASVLDRFLALYVTANAFSRLTTVMQRSGRTLEFPARAGAEILL